MKYNDILTPEQFLQYLNENIYYGYVGKNGKIYKQQDNDEWNNDWLNEYIVQDGESLIQSHYGNCWDQVELERKWFDENNYQFKTIFMWFEENKPNNFPTHTFLVFKKDNKSYWFENSFGQYKGIHKFDTEESLIEYVKECHLEYAMQTCILTKQDRQCISYYEYKKPEPNLGVREYIDFVTHSKK